MKNFIYTFLFFSFLLNGQNSFSAENSLADFIHAKAKIVWLQDKKGGADSLAHSEDLTLWGLDSQDNRGERQIISQRANWFKPLFTPDGRDIIVSNRKKREIYKVNWQSGRIDKIGSGVAVALWQEPTPKNFFLKKRTWLYFFDGQQAENNYFTAQPLYRMRLDKPKKRELVWNKSAISWSSIGISRDGKIMGGLFPWPNGGIIHLQYGGCPKNTEFQSLGKGCWTSLAPDDSYLFWIFDGPHRNLQFFDTKNNTKWLTRINNIPANSGGFEVYHPMWSNDVRFFTLTGFYEKGEGGNRICGGGDNIEVYVGQFSEDMRSVERWFQVTHNDKPDYYPVLWVENGREKNLTLPQKTTDIKGVSQKGKQKLQKQNCIFIWENCKAANQLSTESPIGYYQVQMKLRGKALYSANLQLNLTNGFAESADAGEKIVKAILSAKKLTIEAVVSPTSNTEKGKIIQLGSLITVQQNGEQIVIGTNNKKQVSWKGVFVKPQPTPIAFTFNGEDVELFVNGKSRGTKKFSLFLDAAAEKLNFGDTKWSGEIAEIVFYNSILTQRDIAARAAQMKHTISQYKKPETIKLLATLEETTEIPAPNALGAYRRALVVNSYTVNKVLSGKYSDKKIVIAEWAVLDRSIVKHYPKIPQIEEITAQKFTDHPELEGERQVIDIFEPDLEMWYRLPE